MWPIKYRVLGKTGLKVSEVGFGAWAIGGNAFGNSYGQNDEKASMAAVKTELNLGSKFSEPTDR